MRNFFRILFYIIVFSIGSVIIWRLFEFVPGGEPKDNNFELFLSIIAGMLAGLIVGIFSNGEG